ncbi:MAG: hypothetical protein QOE60_1676, partial [Thermoleophilaceae bacterium]|nr:hypothetical protein [Thermoleophilaceae bacterium]
VVAALEERDIPCAPVIDVVDATASDHAEARARLRRVRTRDGLEVVCPAVAPHVGDAEQTPVESPAEPGEHAHEVLAEWGLDRTEAQALIDSGAVGR